MIEVMFDDLLRQDVDAIVNPANTHMLHGGGLAAIIADSAGPELVADSQRQAPIETGQAIVSKAGELPFKGVIHAVGPVWEGDGNAPYWRQNRSDDTTDVDELLIKAHRSAMDRAAEEGYTSVAFPAISCGVFHFPVDRAAPLAMKAVAEAQVQHPEIERVVFCVLDDYHYDAFCDALGELRTPEEAQET